MPTPQDTAGSERYEAMSRIYYKSAKAAIICYGLLLPCFSVPSYLSVITLSASLAQT